MLPKSRKGAHPSEFLVKPEDPDCEETDNIRTLLCLPPHLRGYYANKDLRNWNDGIVDESQDNFWKIQMPKELRTAWDWPSDERHLQPQLSGYTTNPAIAHAFQKSIHRNTPWNVTGTQLEKQAHWPYTPAPINEIQESTAYYSHGEGILYAGDWIDALGVTRNVLRAFQWELLPHVPENGHTKFANETISSLRPLEENPKYAQIVLPALAEENAQASALRSQHAIALSQSEVTGSGAETTRNGRGKRKAPSSS